MILDAVARRYGCRPSALLRGGWLDYQVDVGVLLVALDAQQAQQAEGHAPRSSTRPSKPAARVAAPVGSEGYADPTALTAYGVSIETRRIEPGENW